MNSSTKHAHADDGRSFGSERVVLEIEDLTRIDNRFPLFLFNRCFGGFLPFLKGVHDVVNDRPGKELDITVVFLKLASHVAGAGFG